MNKSTAEKILAISMECTRDTNASIEQIMQCCDQETFKAYRSHGGRIMGYLFTEVIAPIQSEHIDLAPADFQPMQPVERPRLKLTTEARADLLAFLNQLYEQIDGLADVVRENCTDVETAMYRGRLHAVLVHVSAAIASVLAARVETE